VSSLLTPAVDRIWATSSRKDSLFTEDLSMLSSNLITSTLKILESNTWTYPTFSSIKDSVRNTMLSRLSGQIPIQILFKARTGTQSWMLFRKILISCSETTNSRGLSSILRKCMRARIHQHLSILIRSSLLTNLRMINRHGWRSQIKSSKIFKIQNCWRTKLKISIIKTTSIWRS